MDDNKKIFAAAALFDTPDQIINAARKTTGEGYKNFDVHTPYPVHGMDRAMKLKPSKLGYITLFFGFSGTAFILLFMWWTMSVDYPLVIGGKPFFSLPAFIPITFETTVLLAAVSTVFGMIALFFNLPVNNHPLHDTEYMRNVSADKYGLIIEAEDPGFDENKVVNFLKNLGASRVELVYTPEKVSYPLLPVRFVAFLGVTVLIVAGLTYITLNKVLFMEPFNWMMDQDKVIVQEKSLFYSDGFAVRKPVQGTVARGFTPYPYKGQVNPVSVLTNPLLPSREVLNLGQRKYLTFCSPCHGDYADGDSRLRGQFPNPPTLHSARAREFSDGMIYNIIMNGLNIMPSYAPQTTAEERWAIVHYIRVLQRAKNANPSDLELIKKEPAANVQE